MSTDVPPWADPVVSAEMAVMRARGEGPNLEFKERFPEQARDLAKEIAAFASTNGGNILLGVADDGSLVGLDSVNTPAERDLLIRRIEGVCNGTVKPAITPSASFAVESGKVVLVLAVPRGAQPIYYASCIPFVRQLTTSRPAEPHEVIERIRSFEFADEPSDDATVPEWVGLLSDAILPILVFGMQAEQRMVEPWFSLWRAEFQTSVDTIHDVLLFDDLPAAARGGLRQLAGDIKDAATFVPYVGSGQMLLKLVSQAVNGAEEIWNEYLARAWADHSSLDIMQKTLRASLKKLDQLNHRANEFVERGETDELQSRVAAIGRNLMEHSISFLRSRGHAQSEDFIDIARQLHLIETIRLYLDGGQSQRNLVAQVGFLTDALAEASDRFLLASQHATGP